MNQFLRIFMQINKPNLHIVHSTVDLVRQLLLSRGNTKRLCDSIQMLTNENGPFKIKFGNATDIMELVEKLKEKQGELLR